MGQSGSGKTTFLAMLSGLLRATSGSIELYPPENTKVVIELTGLTQDALARLRLERMGFIFQHSNLLEALTAVENVMMPLLIKGVKRRRPRASWWSWAWKTDLTAGLPSFPGASNSALQ